MRKVFDLMVEARQDLSGYPKVTDQLLDDIVRLICSVGSPLKIVLFGSQADGTAGPYSDIDILIIEQPNCDRFAKQIKYRKAIGNVFPAKDVMVYSLDEAASWCYVPNHFVSQVLKHGRTLFEDVDSLRRYAGARSALSSEDAPLLVCEDVEPRTATDYAKEWFEKGDSDLENARLVITHGTRFDTACFHAQQAIEKYLKGLLLLHGWPLERTHDLNELLRCCRQTVDSPQWSAMRLTEISADAVTMRYPSGVWPSRESAREAVAVAEHVRELVLGMVPPAARP